MAKVSIGAHMITETLLFLLARFCPVWAMRIPSYCSPSDMARTIASGFVVSAVFAALALQAAEHSAEREQELRMLWTICAPAGCVALVALSGFLHLDAAKARSD